MTINQYKTFTHIEPPMFDGYISHVHPENWVLTSHWTTATERAQRRAQTRSQLIVCGAEDRIVGMPGSCGGAGMGLVGPPIGKNIWKNKDLAIFWTMNHVF